MWIFAPLQTTNCSWSSLEEPQNATDIFWMFQLPQHIYNYKRKWYFMLDASTNPTYTTTKYKWDKWGFYMKQLQNECNYQKVGPTPLFCTKRPLVGNLYCSPSHPLYVAVIWSRIYIYIYVIQSSVLKRVQPWIQIVTNSEAGGVNLIVSTACIFFALLLKPDVFLKIAHELSWKLQINYM